MRAVVMGGVALAIGLAGMARAADPVTIKPDDIIAARQAGFRRLIEKLGGLR